MVSVCWDITVVNFYPRPPRGGRLPLPGNGSRDKRISIHALREEGDGTAYKYSCGSFPFLSTPSARRATASTMCDPFNNLVFLSTPSARRATLLC